jgi:hypothetical protein
MAKKATIGMPSELPKGHIRGIWAVTIIAALAMIVVGIVSYWSILIMAQYQETGVGLNPRASTSPLASASASPSASVTDETANWQTYSNSTYNISIKYPTDWKYTEEKTENQSNQTSVPTYTTVHFYEKSKATRIEESINAGGIEDLDAIQLLIVDGTNYNTTLTQFKNYNCTTEEDKVISGVDGKYFYCKPQGANSTYYYLVGKDNKTFYLDTTFATKKDTLDKMIDTFKFL